MYRAIVEGLLGCRIEAGSALRIDPCIPPGWPGFEIALARSNATEYLVSVENPHGGVRGVETVELDGQALPGAVVPLVTDGSRHHVRVVMARPRASAEPERGQGPVPLNT
jgi:cellobiose phosphorylase